MDGQDIRLFICRNYCSIGEPEDKSKLSNDLVAVSQCNLVLHLDRCELFNLHAAHRTIRVANKGYPNMVTVLN
jgi:hypothetical protein